MAAYRSGRCEAADVDGGGAVDGDLRIGACSIGARPPYFMWPGTYCRFRAEMRRVALGGTG